MKKIPIILLLFILMQLSLRPTRSDQIRIAIYDFNAKGVSMNTAKRVSDWIRTAMAGSDFIIMEKTQMDKIFKEQEFSMTGCTDSNCAVQIGRMLSANRVLVGTVEKFGKKYIISGRIVDVEKGVSKYGHKEKVIKRDELDSCAERFAENILRKMSGKDLKKNYSGKQDKKLLDTRGMISTGSGLKYKVLKKGNGPKPKLNNKVLVHYMGTLTNGMIFDNSRRHGKPLAFKLKSVIKGWQEGLQLMPVGSKFKFFIPSKLGYGTRGAGRTIPPNSDLIFIIELIEIVM